MVSIEEFREMLDELAAEIPAEFYVDLNGGILLKEEVKIHPKSRGEDLKIMGEYVRSRYMGRLINIYYGSFMEVYGNLSYNVLRERVNDTLRHELTHHLESLAGYKDLEVEDEVFLHRYLERH
ncbi:MAG: metallopeptidase family protein [Suipraeoptans sp.]